jgi:Trypsin-like peptidase domain
MPSAFPVSFGATIHRQIRINRNLHLMKSFTRPLGLALGCAASLLLLPTGFAQPATPPLPEELIVLRSQPSVFKVFAYGDILATYPKEVKLKTDQLEREYTRQPQGTESKAQFIWRRIAGDPNSYLEASAERVRLALENEAYSTGTAFAVSREGILLTNAHMFEDPTLTFLKPAALQLLREPYVEFLKDLVQAIGERPSPANLKGANDAVEHWYFSMTSTSGKFRELRLALKYGVDGSKLEEVKEPKLSKEVGDFLKPSATIGYIKKAPLPHYHYLFRFPIGEQMQQELQMYPEQELQPQLRVFVKPELEPVTRPLKLLAIGGSFPGEDVAVLQVVLDAEDMVGFRADQPSDRLLCLPLGDSELVLPGSQVRALGFPARAYFAAAMDPSAEMQVSSRNGEIGQTKRLIGGLDVFEMTAEIDHGDSGGPVLDKDGNVIAITVAAPPANDDGSISLAGHKLAVPINIARKYLRQAGITPDRGAAGQLWDESLRVYNQHKFADALRTLETLRLMQEGVDIQVNPILRLPLPNRPFGCPFVSPYLDQLVGICSKKQGAPK